MEEQEEEVQEQKKDVRIKFTKLERAWVLYDVGNSAFTLMVSTLIPIWFYALAGNAGISDSDYLSKWSYAQSVATVCVALIGPIFGTFADNKGFRKPIFTVSLVIGAAACALMGFMTQWIAFLAVFVIAKTAYQSCNVFYDSMINDVTTPERMDQVSSHGYAWGYLGSCIPFIAALALYVLGGKLGLSDQQVCLIDMVLIAAWWFGVGTPLLKNYRQIYYVESRGNTVGATFKRLGHTLSTMVRENKRVFVFLLAFFFYIDGVYTIIDIAVAFGTSLGLDTVGLLLILLATQVIAWFFSLLFGRLAKIYSSILLISVCIGGYFVVAVMALFVNSLLMFFVMAFLVGMFQGTIQALSRSYYGKIIPAENSGEYFGLYDICGKGAAFLGTLLIGVTSDIFESSQIGVASLAVLFVVGFILLQKSAKMAKSEEQTA